MDPQTRVWVAGQWLESHWPYLLIVAAWLCALGANAAGFGYVFNHDQLIEGARLPWLAAGAAFLLAWQIMFGAMMVPASLPVFRLRPWQWHFTRFLLAGAAVWSGFALMAFVGDTGVHHLVDAWPWLYAHSGLIAGGTLLLAGTVQLTPQKRRFMAQCRDAQGFLARHHGRGTWSLGWDHGRICLGSDWALMLLMFGLGVGNVLWMAGLAAVMALEKWVPQGDAVRVAVAAVLLPWGAIIATHALVA